MSTYTKITHCRNCKHDRLVEVLSLGNQALTGVFPDDTTKQLDSGPVDLVWCMECGLLQLKQSYSPSDMYGMNYGYRSGLNQSMVDHLRRKVRSLETMVPLNKLTDMVVDIGSNDSTLLRSYSANCRKVGIDPSGIKFKEFYPRDVELIPDFFSSDGFKRKYGDTKAKIITSIAMFYDLEDPNAFVNEIREILDPDVGIWHTEQAYMPTMLKNHSYDAICQEHLEFYSFKVVKDIVEKAGMKVIDVSLNGINGGSFAVTVAHKSSKRQSNVPIIEWLLMKEEHSKLNRVATYLDFADAVESHAPELVQLVRALNDDGKTVLGYGASTKGNVMLQYCGFTKDDIPAIADVNPDKHGKFTPGTNIPIISEKEAKQMNPDYFLVLPWHFRENILSRERHWVEHGGKFIFPLPEIEIV